MSALWSRIVAVVAAILGAIRNALTPLLRRVGLMKASAQTHLPPATGGRWEEDDYQSTGSGSAPAKNSLKKRWKPGLPREEALRVAVEALLDASEDDVATGGPDVYRKIYPTVLTVTADGSAEVPEDEVAAAVTAVIEERA